MRLPLAVVAHDAGAANLILGWVRGLPAHRLRLCVAGPAAHIFAAEFPESPFVSAAAALDGAAMLISGTSSPSINLEHEARRLARFRGVRSVGVIDHWVNYAPRFVRGGETLLPDEIWVVDAHAAKLARDTFSGVPIYELPNSYLDNLVDQVRAASRPHPGATHVLYVLEPQHSDWGRGGIAGEFQALNFFQEHASLLGLPAGARIRLRPHPSDASGKYSAWLEGQGNPSIELDSLGTLPEAIGWADWVVGCESYALIAGLAAGRRVASTLPPWAPVCRLPQPELVHLRDLIQYAPAETK